MYTPCLFISSCIDGHLGCFHRLAGVTDASILLTFAASWFHVFCTSNEPTSFPHKCCLSVNFTLVAEVDITPAGLCRRYFSGYLCGQAVTFWVMSSPLQFVCRLELRGNWLRGSLFPFILCVATEEKEII